MKWTWALLLAFPTLAWLHSVADRNAAKSKIDFALDSSDFTTAIATFHHLMDSLDAEDSTGTLQLTLSHAWYVWGERRRDSLKAELKLPEEAGEEELAKWFRKAKQIQADMEEHLGGVSQWDSAMANYLLLGEHAVTSTRSIARNQMGVLTAESDEEAALSHFKEALKADPTNEAARYNYELLKKYIAARVEDDPEDTDDATEPDKPEPSEYAKRLKEKAESLVNDQQYAEALSLMLQGLQEDPSVKAFEDFISRIQVITEIQSQSKEST